jgi:Ca2+/Na+ antiporter
MEDVVEDGRSYLSLGAMILAVVACIALYGASLAAPEENAWRLGFLLAEVMLISLVLWQACDPFADAAQWIGRVFRLPGSVRGATLDAVASSMPELFSGIFFVVLAFSAAGESESERIAAGAEGYGATIATCAGSAIYNMILIPAFCAIVIFFRRRSRPVIDIEDEVIVRDGLWFIGCELLLIAFLFRNQMEWWMGCVFLGLYAVYIGQLALNAFSYRWRWRGVRRFIRKQGKGKSEEEIYEAMKEAGEKVNRQLVHRAYAEHLAHGKPKEERKLEDRAGILFGFFNINLNLFTVPLVLIGSTLAAAAACYFLVEATRATAELLDVPAFFVAVVMTAAASSLPDTFLAIGAASRGDDSGAVSNAFGSNIFDICICLSIPLFVSSYLTGWQPVSLMQDGEPIRGLVTLRILLVVLSALTLGIMWHKRRLTIFKAIILVALYLVFLGYAILGSLGMIS